MDPADVAAARRVLIVHTIGSAAYATSPPDDEDAQRPVSSKESWDVFTRSLHWLLAGITHSAGEVSTDSSDSSRRQS